MNGYITEPERFQFLTRSSRTESIKSLIATFVLNAKIERVVERNHTGLELSMERNITGLLHKLQMISDEIHNLSIKTGYDLERLRQSDSRIESSLLLSITEMRSIYEDNAAAEVRKQFSKDFHGTKYIVGKVAMTFSDARDFCTSIGTRLPEFSEEEDYKKVALALNANNMSCFWLGYERILVEGDDSEGSGDLEMDDEDYGQEAKYEFRSITDSILPISSYIWSQMPQDFSSNAPSCVVSIKIEPRAEDQRIEYKWKPKTCQKKVPFVCQLYRPEKENPLEKYIVI